MMEGECDEEPITPFETSPLYDLLYGQEMPKFTFDRCSPHESHRFSNRLANAIINTRCSDQCKFTLSAFLGILAILMQIPPLFLINWIEIQEPKAVNQTDDQGELINAPFLFSMGYFKVCREPSDNMTDFKPVDPELVRLHYPRLCAINPVFTNDDLSDYSFVSAIILSKLLIPSILQIFGVLMGMVGLFLSFVGQFRYNKQTIISAMVYISSGLLIFAAVLQFICAVDDEMNSRMKPTMTGELSKFDFKYGPSFLSTSLSFLPLQVCVYLQTKLYFDRFPLPLDTAQIVPGLGEMIGEMIARSRKGLPPSTSFSNHRRDSRCSREVAFGGIQQEVQHLAPPLTESLSKPAIHFCI